MKTESNRAGGIYKLTYTKYGMEILGLAPPFSDSDPPSKNPGSAPVIFLCLAMHPSRKVTSITKCQCFYIYCTVNLFYITLFTHTYFQKFITPSMLTYPGDFLIESSLIGKVYRNIFWNFSWH